MITIVGNLSKDPELRFTASGAAVVKFTVVTSKRELDKTTNQWKDGPASYFDCSIWREYAENIAESLVKGNRVVVTGEMRQRSYETREGEKRSAWELHAEDVGACLRYATVQVKKAERGKTGLAAIPDDPWTTPAPDDAPPF